MNECEETLVITNKVIYAGAYVITENQKTITIEENINSLWGRVR